MTLLRIAIPNKGSLSQSATEMLREAGYRQRSDAKQLTVLDTENNVEFFYLRPRDIALYVGEGTLDVGITGRDLLLDSGADADEVIPPEAVARTAAALEGRSATSISVHPGLGHGIDEAELAEVAAFLR